MPNIEITGADYTQLTNVIDTGDITKASKADLERYAIMLCRPDAWRVFSEKRISQISEIVRLLLMARVSQEINREAKRISIVALLISAFALVPGVVQALAAVDYLSKPLSSQVMQQPASTSPAAVPAQK